MTIQPILYYKIHGGSAMVTGYKNADAGLLIVPDTIDGVPVTAIGARAFWGHPMTAVTLPASVQTIGAFAFSGCADLTEIRIPDGVTFLQEGIFRHCKSLRRIELPASVTHIGAFAFRGCSGLDQVQYAGTAAQWKQISVGKGNPALRDAECLCSSHPDSTASAAQDSGTTFSTNTKSEASAAAKTPESKASAVPDGLHYKLLDDQAVITDFSNHACTRLTIPDTIDGCPVTAIGDLAFHNCSALTAIHIPGSVTRIGSLAFGNCSGLKDVTYGSMPMRWKRILIGAGNEYLLQSNVQCSNSASTLPPSCLRYKFIGSETVILDCRPTSGRELAIPAAINGHPVTRIADGAFLDCDQMESIELPASIRHIGYHAFDGCGSLKEIFYAGTREEGKALCIQPGNEVFTTAEVCFADEITAARSMIG